MCRIDASGLCVGCRRTRAEIADWPFLTNPQRAAVMKTLAERPPAETGR
jgi:predicted Fe-S protein YdhL (DUF1289 family)